MKIKEIRGFDRTATLCKIPESRKGKLKVVILRVLKEFLKELFNLLFSIIV